MTKEQKAIEILTKKVDSWKCKRPRNPIILKRLIDEIDTENNAIETVLNMLKEKDKEIEHWKNGFERELEDNRKNTCELLKQDLIIREKDKQIDLMAKEIKEENYNFANKNIKEIKQYFERQAEQR